MPVPPSVEQRGGRFEEGRLGDPYSVVVMVVEVVVVVLVVVVVGVVAVVEEGVVVVVVVVPGFLSDGTHRDGLPAGKPCATESAGRSRVAGLPRAERAGV
jgi:hypothetical protein